ncbi:unnamed protein product [Sphacelaria rigidula]
MKTACAMVLACAAGASAFVAPSAFRGAALTAAKPASSSMKMSFEGEIGAQAPIGYWDPLGLLIKDPTQERFDRLRYVEIKHGRIAMLAVLGHITQQNFRLPGMLSPSAGLSFADCPNGVAALSKIPLYGLIQIFLFIGFLETQVMYQKEGSFPGDMSMINPFEKEWEAWTEEEQAVKRSIELNNGRAAQMGILGLMVHEQMDNHPYIINEILGSHVAFN